LTFSTNSAFEFPRNLGLSSLPRTEPVRTKPFGFDMTIRTRKRRSAYLGVNDISEETTDDGKKYFSTALMGTVSDAELAEAVRMSDRVYLVFSRRPRGAHKARILRNWVSAHEVDPTYTYVEYGDPIEHDNFRIALENPVNGIDLEAKSVPSLIEQYFEYNYLLNSLPIMSATSNSAIGRDVAGALSREMLQILFHLRDHSGIEFPFFVKSIVNWKGTGRHEGTVRLGWGDGSTADDPSVELLVKQGLAEITQDNKVVITEDGRRLLEAIHPDCRDIDQNHRLKEWMTLGEAAARGKIDQYVKTFFGKQLRHLKV